MATIEKSKAEVPVLEYQNLSEFLRDHYAQMKARNPKFSYELWSRALKGFDRSYLRQIVMGKRSISDEVVPHFTRYFRMGPEETDQFVDLVDLAKSRAKARRKILLDRIQRRKRYRESVRIVEDAREFLSNRHVLVVATLLSFEDVDKTPEGLAALLNERPQDVLAWLQILDRLGLAKRDSAQAVSWHSTQRAFRVPTKLGDQSLIAHHKQVLEKAIDCMSCPPETRRFESMLMALSVSEYAELLALLDRFRRETLE